MSDLLYSGTASAPTAGTAVVQSGALPAGRYKVVVTTYLEDTGTPAVGTDDNNMALYSDTTEIGPLCVVTTKGVPAVSPEITVTVADSKKLTVKAVANATASVTYSASMRVHMEAGY